MLLLPPPLMAPGIERRSFPIRSGNRTSPEVRLGTQCEPSKDEAMARKTALGVVVMAQVGLCASESLAGHGQAN